VTQNLNALIKAVDGLTTGNGRRRKRRGKSK
jgi:hypothetical protein